MKNWIKLFISAGSTGDEYWIRRLHTIALSGNGAALVLLGTFMNKSELPIEQIQASKQYFIPFIVGLFFALICAVTGVTTSRAHELKTLMYGSSNEVKNDIKEMENGLESARMFDVLKAQNTDIKIRGMKELQETYFSEGSKLNKMHRNIFIVFAIMLSFSYTCFMYGLVKIGYF